MAGLRAAADLRAHGAEVVLLEARERPGGRVWSRTEGFADQQHAESGAEVVEGNHREVLALVAQAGLTLVPDLAGQDPARQLVDHGTRLASLAAVDAATSGAVTADLRRWERVLDQLADLVPEPDDPLAGPFAAELDRRTAAEVLADAALAPLARLVVGRCLRTAFMVPPDEVSLLHLAWRAAAHHGARSQRQAWRVAGGLQRLAEVLTTGLGERVHYQQAVTAVRDDGRQVTVDASGGTWVATGCVLALPPPALSRVAVEPALPGPVVDVGRGLGGKVSVQVARRLWLDQACDGSVVSDRPYGQLWETSTGMAGDHGVLTALVSSHDGAALLALPDAAARVQREMARVFPGLDGFARTTVAHDWGNDPWALGTRAAFAPGQLGAAWALLRQRHGRIVLAGEHTDGFAGTVEGALRSGARAARILTA